MYLSPKLLAVGSIFVVMYSTLAGLASAQADPGEPCAGTVALICRFVPVMPDQEGDIDLTTDQPAAPPGPAPMEAQLPPDLCAGVCL